MDVGKHGIPPDSGRTHPLDSVLSSSEGERLQERKRPRNQAGQKVTDPSLSAILKASRIETLHERLTAIEEAILANSPNALDRALNLHTKLADRSDTNLDNLLQQTGLRRAHELLLTAWAAIDGQSAYEYVIRQSNVEPDSESSLLVAVFYGWISFGDDEAAITRLKSLGNRPDFDYVVLGVSSFLGQTEPEKGIQWASSLPEGVRSDAVQNAALGWIASEPIAAVKWIRDSLAEDRFKGDDRITSVLIREAILNLQRSSPETVEGWAAGLPTSQARTTALTILSEQ